MPKFHLINFSPYTNNILDYIDKPLITKDGRRVKLTRRGMEFDVFIEPIKVPIISTDNNLRVSYLLNKYAVGEEK